jgi:hypothetical protein
VDRPWGVGLSPLAQASSPPSRSCPPNSPSSSLPFRLFNSRLPRPAIDVAAVRAPRCEKARANPRCSTFTGAAGQPTSHLTGFTAQASGERAATALPAEAPEAAGPRYPTGRRALSFVTVLHQGVGVATLGLPGCDFARGAGDRCGTLDGVGPLTTSGLVRPVTPPRPRSE